VLAGTAAALHDILREFQQLGSAAATEDHFIASLAQEHAIRGEQRDVFFRLANIQVIRGTRVQIEDVEAVGSGK